MTRANLVLSLVLVALFAAGVLWRSNRVEKPAIVPIDPMEAQVASEPFRLEVTTRRLILKVSQGFDGDSGYSIDIDRRGFEGRRTGRITRDETEQLFAFLQAQGLVNPPDKANDPIQFPFILVRYGSVKSRQGVASEERLHETLARAPGIGPALVRFWPQADAQGR